MTTEYWNRPCAARGLTSYRIPGLYGWVMIGATDNADAIREARRSTDTMNPANLEVWNGSRYVNAQERRV